MARRYLLYLVAAAGLLTAAAFALGRLASPQAPSLQELSGAAALPQQFQLYSGELDPNTGQLISSLASSVEILSPSGIPTLNFVREKDRSTDDLQLKPDGEHIASSRSYYPEQAGDPGRHLHAIRDYATTSDTMLDEQIFRFNGKLAEHTASDEKGGEHVIGYGLDGFTVVREVTIAPRQYPWDEPVLQKEEHWREDAAHSIAFRNSINADKTRTLIDWDASGRELKVIHEPEAGIAGTTAIAYYPGTNKIRLDALADYYAMTARYLRFDGTLDHIVKLSPSVTIIQYFNPHGTKITLEQTWWRKTEIVSGAAKFNYQIYSVSEFDDHGQVSRLLDFNEGKLDYIEVHDVHLNGITYAEVDDNYDAAGWLNMIRYWKTMGHPADVEEPHTAAQNIRQPAIPPRDLTMAVDPSEDNLPIPPPQRGYPG